MRFDIFKVSEKEAGELKLAKKRLPSISASAIPSLSPRGSSFVKVRTAGGFHDEINFVDVGFFKIKHKKGEIKW
jgi:hypothetical protein